MPILGHTSIASTSNYGSSSAPVDVTGAKLIVAVVGAYANGGVTTAHLTFLDSKGNTYLGRTIYSGGVPWCRIFYCIVPTTDTGLTFSFGGGYPYYPSACIAWFDDTVTGVGAQNGATSSGTQTALATGAATPATSNTLAIAGFNPCDHGAGTITVDGGFTITDQVLWASALREGTALAFLYTTSTSALGPTFTIPTASTQGLASAISIFELASSGSTVTLAQASWGWTGNAANVNAKTMLALAQASWAWAASAAGINARSDLTLAQVLWPWTGFSAIVAGNTAVTLAQAAWDWIGIAAAVNAKAAVTLAQAAWDWIGNAPGIATVVTLRKAAWQWVGRPLATGQIIIGRLKALLGVGQ